MKLSLIFVAFALSSFVESHFMAAAIRGIEPIILSFGAAFAALGLDNKLNYDDDAHFIRMKNMKKLLGPKGEEEEYLEDQEDLEDQDGMLNLEDGEIEVKPTLIEEYNEKAKKFAEDLVDAVELNKEYEEQEKAFKKKKL